MSAIDNRPCCSNHDPQRPLGPQANPSQVIVKKESLAPTEETGEDGEGAEDDDDDEEGVDRE